MKDAERFWKRVRRSDGCWEWTAGIGSRGYGNFWCSGTTIGAHIFSYELNVGPRNGLWVLHTCDNQKCVRPDHLFLGTCLDNIKDRCAKGRSARGFKMPRTKVGPEDIAAIVWLYRLGFNRRLIGRWYNIVPIHVNRLVRTHG